MDEQNIRNQEDSIAKLTKRVYKLEQQMAYIQKVAPHLVQQMEIEQVRPPVNLEKEKKPEFIQAPVQQPLTLQESIEQSLRQSNIPQNVQQNNVNHAQPQYHYNPPPPQPIKPKAESNIENKIGKTIMPIIAAVLVLFSIILFGGLMLPYITDGVKYIIMLAVCFAFTFFGLVKANKESKFYPLSSAITAVGICGFYITNLIGYFAFHIFDSIILMFLILVWLAGTIYLAKQKSRMFLYICNVGLIISAILATEEWTNAYLGVILYFVGLGIVYYMCRENELRKDAFIFIQIPVISLFFSGVYIGWPILAFIAVNLVVLVTPYILYKDDNKSNVVLILQQILLIFYVAVASIMLAINKDTAELITIATFTYAIIYAIVRFMNKDSKPIYYISQFGFLLSLSLLNIIPIFDDYFGFIAIALAVGLYGYWKNDNSFKYPGLIYLGISLIYMPTEVGKFTLVIIFACIVALFIYAYTTEYRIENKGIAALFLVFWSISLCSNLNIGNAIEYVIFSSISIYLNTKLFYTNPKTKEPETLYSILGYIMNGFMLIISLILVGSRNYVTAIYLDGVRHVIIDRVGTFIIVFLFTAAIASINVKRTIDRKHAFPMLAGCYTGLKFTAILWIVLARFNTISFIVTIFLFLFAIACIAIGLSIKYKPFRVYGLVLSLFSVIKITLFDISYDSIILKPVALLIAGLLCFGVSWIYTMLEKKQQEIESVDQPKIDNSKNVVEEPKEETYNPDMALEDIEDYFNNTEETVSVNNTEE